MEKNNPPINSKFDWLLFDRDTYTRLSYDIKPPWPPDLITKNSFCNACLAITKERRPTEFDMVRQRNAYYDFISYIMEFSNLPHQKAKQIKFFHATTVVTTWNALGAIEGLVGNLMLSNETIAVLKDVNALLLGENMYVIYCLLFTKESNIPFEFVNNNPCVVHPKEISCFEFDLQMVRFEQSIVRDYILNHKSVFTNTVTDEINGTLNLSTLKSILKPNSLADIAIAMAKSGLKLTDLDFLNYRHRTAIGFAAVHIFQRKIDEYSDYLKKINYI